MSERERMLEEALRAALRRLDGVIYMDGESAKRRPSEGAIVFEWDRMIPSRYTVTLVGVVTRDECFTILGGIDSGEDPIVAADDWNRDAPLVRYRSQAGHEVTIFVDCQGWDYIERIVLADGRRWEYGDEPSFPGVPDEIGGWEPREPNRWGLHVRAPYGLTGDRKAIAKIPRIDREETC